MFVTNMTDAIYLLAWFYNQRTGAKNLIEEANNDAGWAVHPSGPLDDELQPFPTGDAGLQPIRQESRNSISAEGARALKRQG